MVQTANHRHDANGAQTLKAFEAYSGGSFVATAATAEHYRFDLRGRLAQVENVQGPLRGATIDGRLTSTFHYDHLNAKVRVEQTLPPGTPWRNQTTYLVDHHNPTGYSQVLEERNTLGNIFGTELAVVLPSDAPLHSFLWGHGLISQNGALLSHFEAAGAW